MLLLCNIQLFMHPIAFKFSYSLYLLYTDYNLCLFLIVVCASNGRKFSILLTIKIFYFRLGSQMNFTKSLIYNYESFFLIKKLNPHIINFFF